MTYSFRCSLCYGVSDFRMSMSETKPEMKLPCPVCEQETDHVKVITTTGGFQLKGKGWFKTGGY